MPQAIPIIIGAVATAGGALVVTGSITTALILGGISLALGFINQALTDQPDIGFDEEQRQARTITTRDTIQNRNTIYGETRIGGTTAFIESTNDDRFLHLVIMWASHECDRVRTILINEDPVFENDLDGDGNVISGKYSGKVRIRHHLGSDSQTVDTVLASETPSWGSNHRLQGICYSYIRLDSDPDLFSGIPNITAVIKGKKVFDPRTSLTKWTPNSVLCLRDYYLDVRYGLDANASEINDTQVNASANVCDELVDVKIVDQGISSVDTDNDILFLGTQLNLAFQTGDRVEIVTTGTPPAPLEVSTDYYLIVRQEYNTPAVQLATTYQNALDEIVIDITTTGSPVNVVRKNGEPRYTCNGVILTSDSHKNNIDNILSSMAGSAVYALGEWELYSGYHIAGSLALEEKDLIGPIIVQTKESARTRFNRIQGIYISPINMYQPDDYPLVKNATYLSEDNNREAKAVLDLPFTSRSAVAERIAKISLEKHRQMQRVSIACKLRKAFQIKAYNNFDLNNIVHGFTDKEFQTEEWVFGVDKGKGGDPVFTVRLQCRETAAAVYDWNMGEETAKDLAANTTLPSSFSPAPPTLVSLSSGNPDLFLAADGTVHSRIRVSWTGSISSLVTGYEIQWKLSSDSLWKTAVLANSGDVEAFLAPVEDNANYDVRIRARNDSFFSDWEPVFAHTVIGKTAPPTLPDSFNISVLPDGTRIFKWIHNSPDADVRSGGGYKIRYFLGSTSDWSAMTSLHEGIVVISPHESNDPAAGTYTFAIKSIDSSDNESTDTIFISNVILGNPRIENALLQRNEASFNWPGVLVDCFHDTIRNTLLAESDQAWSDLPTAWNSLATSWDAILTNKDPIQYTSPEIDLGRDFTFKPLITPTVEGTATVTFQFGTDADGAPVGAFIVPQVVIGRYLKIRCSVADTKAKILGLTTIIDAPAQVETYDDIDTSSSVLPEFESIAEGHFKLQTFGGISFITQAHIQAIQNVGPGFTWELIDKNTTISGGSLPAAEFKVYDSTNTLADATVDVLLRGARV